jgi:hypothetical protein
MTVLPVYKDQNRETPFAADCTEVGYWHTRAINHRIDWVFVIDCDFLHMFFTGSHDLSLSIWLPANKVL